MQITASSLEQMTQDGMLAGIRDDSRRVLRLRSVDESMMTIKELMW